MRKIEVLGIWWAPPRGSFPVYGLALRLRQLSDAEAIHVGDAEVISVYLGDADVSYGHAVFLLKGDGGVLILLGDREDWEALKHEAEERSKSRGVGYGEALVELVERIAEKGSGYVDLDEL